MRKIFSFLEKHRIKFHLMRVEMKLRRKDVSHLPANLQIQRNVHLDVLHNYWTNGKFPKNIHYPGKRLPHFPDHRGILCAVGFLIYNSGNKELVDNIARTDNLVRINDVKKGPLIDWINTSGLTQEEAAEIQPAYDYPPPGPDHSGLALFVLTTILFLSFEFFNIKIIKKLKINNKFKVLTHIYFGGTSLLTSFILSLFIVALFF